MSDILLNKKYNRQQPDSFAGLPMIATVALFAACFFFICAAATLPGVASAADTDRYPKRVAVFISREIKPYLQAVDALTRRLNEAGQYRLKQIVFDASEKNDPDPFREQIKKGDYDLVVTVGPEASRFVAENRMESIIPVVYTMLLNPEDIFDSEESICGVSLNVPIESQLQEIKKTLPNLITIGVLFDPEYNAQFVHDAMMLGKTMNINVEAIAVSDKASIPKALSANWHQIEAIWLIPDWTVTSSESINQYIIKEALLRKDPVIGYNRSFYNYGAAIALILDYGKIGEQTAGIVIDRLENGVSRREPPSYETAVNQRVLDQIGINPAETGEGRAGQP